VSVVDAPAHIEDTEALTLMLGDALTVITLETRVEQPAVLVPVHEYVVVELGATDMLAEVAPLLHK